MRIFKTCTRIMMSFVQNHLWMLHLLYDGSSSQRVKKMQEKLLALSGYSL